MADPTADSSDSPVPPQRCPRCDAPIYADEGVCHYHHGIDFSRIRSLDWLFYGLAGGLTVLLALIAAARG